MEIYKLGDEIPDEENRQQGWNRGERNASRIAGCSLKRVTDLKQGVKNPNRVNVFVDGVYALSLDVAQVVDLGVKIGLVVDENRLAELKKASEFGKVYQRALEWVLARPRSERELRDYLRRRERTAEMKEKQNEWQTAREEKPKRKKATKQSYDFDDLVVERLKERGYVDDRRFAEYFVENRFVKKGVSRKRLEMELLKKGVVQEIIGEVLGARSDEEEIQKIIAKKRAKYDDEKLIQYLCRQGFSYELVRNLVRSETD